MEYLPRITILLMALLPVFVSGTFSQTFVFGKVQDAFLKVPLPEAKVSLLLAADSSVVIDSIPVSKLLREDGTVREAQFMLKMEKKKCNYLIRATLDGYEDGWSPLAIDGNDGAWMLDDALELRRKRQKTLNEAVVRATRVKMYHKGDTLVYNADAFKLPDGSMLDALIRQLPGVTMDDDGQIFVNGRKVDELLLGSRSFMLGNSKVLMENLPYYTVKDIKVYEKQSAMSEALGHDVDARKFVMDVNMKKEYSRGYIANVETAVGTQDRWLGRAFLLGFTSRWRFSVLGNVNNVNETRHIGSEGHWTPATMPKSLLTTRSVATNLNYHLDEKKLTNNLNADFTSSDTKSEMRQRYEQFLDGSKPTSLTENYNESGNWRLKLDNELQLLKPSYLQFVTRFDYEKRNSSSLSQFGQWDDGLTASMRTDALGKGRSWSFFQQAVGAFDLKRWYTNYVFLFWHNDNQSWLSNRYDTWQSSTQANDVRHNASDVYNKSTNVSLSNLWRYSFPSIKSDFIINGKVHYSDSRNHDYLYHPDTLLLSSQLDMLNAILDRSNSYNSYQRNWGHSVDISFSKSGIAGMVMYTRWMVGLDVPVLHHSLDYQRGIIDTLMHDTWVYFKPHADYRYVSPDARHDFKISADYKCDPVAMVNRIAYRDDSNPLVVKEGNSSLKGTSQTNVTADYTNKFGKHAKQWHIGAVFNYRHRDVAQSVAYNPITGVYTYKPMNISGAYNLTSKFDISSSIDEKRYWTWQMNADASYNHSVDHTILAGETESRVNAVNTSAIHDGAYIQYNKDALNIRATGDVNWRHSEGKMRDFETLNAVDFRYGLSARYTIPVLNTTVSADGNIYSRRGYGSAKLNTNDFVLNASISQPLLKGKLIARIEAFDLLHQLSSTQYAVNAQGRTETWYRSLPHYIMAHFVYHFNMNPKRK